MAEQLDAWSAWLSYRAVACVGSWTYVVFEVTAILVWLFVNSYGSQAVRFDPAPYAMLDLVLSFIQVRQNT